MSTPTAVRFSVIGDDPLDSLRLFVAEFPRLEMELEQVGRLGLDEEGHMAFLGQEVDCTTVEEVVERGAAWQDFAVSCIAYPVPGRLYVYLWRSEAGTCLALEIPPTAVTFESDDYQTGQWLIQLLLAACQAFRVEVCGYGKLYGHKFFTPLSTAEIVAAVKDDSLFEAGYPSIHLISSAQIGTEEMAKLAKPHEARPRFHYGLSAPGFHVLSLV